MLKYFIPIFILLSNSAFSYDVLNEMPIYPIPEEMTFEEYQDINRRLSVGLLLSSISIPGTIHDYAAEPNTAKKIRWGVAGGFLSVIAGASMAKEGDWQDSPYEIYILNEGQDDEIRYEMIPKGSVGDDIIYDYVQLEKKYNDNGLVVLGMGVIIASYIYDYMHGIKVIEEKRDKARFKYGKIMNLSLYPTYDLYNQSAGIKLSYNFKSK